MNEVHQADACQPVEMPAIRTITANDVKQSLKEGIADFLAAPLYGLFFGGIYTVGGLLILAFLTTLDMGWMIIPVGIAFPLIGPFVAVGLYEVSRRRAAGTPLNWSEVLGVIIAQKERQFGLMAFTIICIFWFWIVLVRLLLALFLGFQSFPTVVSFITIVMTTPEGLGFLLVGSAIGSVFAMVLFCTTVIAIPLLLDRDIDVISAIITSFQSVIKNPVVMIGWGIIVAVLAILAMLPYFLGILIVFPILGHATWHLFERAIEKA